MQQNQREGAELSANCCWISHQSQYLLPRWLCLAQEDQPACAGVALCLGHPSVSMETLSGTLPSLLPLRYPHQARAATHTRKNLKLQGMSWTMAQRPYCCFLDDTVVAQTKLSDKTTSILLLDLDSSLQYFSGLAWAHQQPWGQSTKRVFQG